MATRARRGHRRGAAETRVNGIEPAPSYHVRMTDKKSPSTLIPFIATGILVFLSFLVMTHSPTGKPETSSDGLTHQLVCHSLTDLKEDTGIEELDSGDPVLAGSDLTKNDFRSILRMQLQKVSYCNSARQGLLSWMMFLGPATIASAACTLRRGRQVWRHWVTH